MIYRALPPLSPASSSVSRGHMCPNNNDSKGVQRRNHISARKLFTQDMNAQSVRTIMLYAASDRREKTSTEGGSDVESQHSAVVQTRGTGDPPLAGSILLLVAHFSVVGTQRSI
jgi:hypothetical protein